MTKKIVIAALATVVMIVVMRWMGIGLISNVSPLGIVSFELAPNFSTAKEIVNTVGQKPLQWNVGIDFLFILAYTFSFSFVAKR